MSFPGAAEHCAQIAIMPWRPAGRSPSLDSSWCSCVIAAFKGSSAGAAVGLFVLQARLCYLIGVRVCRVRFWAGSIGQDLHRLAMTLAAIDPHATILEMNIESKKRGDRYRPKSRTSANVRDNQSIVLIVAPR